MPNVFTEGKMKPAKKGDKVADFPNIDGEVQTDQVASKAITPEKLGADSDQNKIDMRAKMGAAPLNSPDFTGTPTAPTPVAAGGDTEVATKKYVDDNSGALNDDDVTPAKLDADDETKQDAFLARLNALRRDLNNIATLTIAQQRTLLLATGTLIDGARPAPSAAYSGRTWIDDHDDRAYVCRNRQEVSSAVGGLWADADTTTAGVEIAENLGDLDDPASVNDYAYTYSDNKWWRGSVRNTQSVWRETQPTTALSVC